MHGTKLTYEEQINHYKGDSYFTMAPQYFTVQEADGTKVALLDSYQQLCAVWLQHQHGRIYRQQQLQRHQHDQFVHDSLRQSRRRLPIIDPACNVISSYFRSQPTREIFPTEIFRFQSSSIKNVSMNGNVRYTNANMNLPNYYDRFQGLDGAIRSIAFAGKRKRQAGGDGRRLRHRLAGDARPSASKIRSTTRMFTSREAPGSQAERIW